MESKGAKATSWIQPNRELLEEAMKLELQGDPVSSDFSVQIEVVTTGEYPDGTKWEKKEPTEDNSES